MVKVFVENLGIRVWMRRIYVNNYVSVWVGVVVY